MTYFVSVGRTPFGSLNAHAHVVEPATDEELIGLCQSLGVPIPFEVQVRLDRERGEKSSN